MDELSGQLAGSCARRPPALSTPQTGTSARAAPAPAPTPAITHLAASSAPVQLALSWPGTTGTAGGGGGDTLGLAQVCAGPWMGDIHSGNGLFLRALDASLGVPMPCSNWELPVTRATDGKGQVLMGDRYLQRHTRDRHVLMARVAAEPRHSVRSFPYTQWPFLVNWDWK